MSESACFLYLIEAENCSLHPRMEMFKVGISNSVGARLATFQTATPFKLGLIQAIRLPNRDVAREFERKMHEYLDDSCVSGEWFCTHSAAALIELDSIAVHYWIGHGGDMDDLPLWFEQIGLDPACIPDVLDGEGLR